MEKKTKYILSCIALIVLSYFFATKADSNEAIGFWCAMASFFTGCGGAVGLVVSVVEL